VLIASPKVATYDLEREMSAPEVVDALRSRSFPFIVVNFANGDMLGRTAVREAVIEAVEVLDREVGRVLDAAVEDGCSVVVSADHGSCGEMMDPVTGEPRTRHTVYPGPRLVIDETAWRLSVGTGIDRIAPTVLRLMDLPKSSAMEGPSLLVASVKAGDGAG